MRGVVDNERVQSIRALARERAVRPPCARCIATRIAVPRVELGTFATPHREGGKAPANGWLTASVRATNGDLVVNGGYQTRKMTRLVTDLNMRRDESRNRDPSCEATW